MTKLGYVTVLMGVFVLLQWMKLNAPTSTQGRVRR